MEKISLLSLVFQGFPEVVAVVICLTAFAKKPLKFNQIISISIIGIIAAIVVRYLDVGFGVHTIVNIFVLSISLSLVSKVRMSSALISSVLAFIILMIGEIVFNELLLYVLNISVDQLRTNQWLWIAFGLPQVIFTLTVGLLYSRFRNRDEDANPWLE